MYVRNFTLNEIPVFVKCGAIIPLKVEDSSNSMDLSSSFNYILLHTQLVFLGQLKQI